MSNSRLNEVLNLMKERVALSQIVRQDVNLQKKGREFVGHCPFHNEKTGSFFVNDDKGTFYCFGCGVSGDIVEYLMRKRGIQFMQAVDVLSEISGIKIPEKIDHADSSFKVQKSILAEILQLFKNNLTMNSEAYEYCKKRGVTDELIKKFSIGYSPKNSSEIVNHLKKLKFSYDDIFNSGVFSDQYGKLVCRFRDRLMFPVFDKNNNPIAFGGRSIQKSVQKDTTPKYINSPETLIFKKRETLYNYNNAVKNISKTVSFILVEGYMDVIMMDKHGFNTAVASMGTAFSSQHLAKLWRYDDCPIVCLDGDEAGYNAMVKIAFMSLEYLQPGKSLRFCKIPEDNDPDSFLSTNSQSEMIQIISNAQNLIDFMWTYFSNKLDAMANKTPENIAEWKQEIFNHIDEIQNADIKSLYKQDIKKRIFDILGKNNVSKIYKNKLKEAENIKINKNEKIILLEAVLLYTLILCPSIIPVVVEDLATTDAFCERFETLKKYIIDNPDEQDFSQFHDVIAEMRRIAGNFCDYLSMKEYEVIDFWRDVFNCGIARNRALAELKMAKDECQDTFDASAWERYKTLKLGIFDSQAISKDTKE